MSWDVDLIDDRGHFEGEWNYTHNCNHMIAAAIVAADGECPDDNFLVGPTWWDRLDGMSGPDGAECLGSIVGALEADPDTYKAMNPENGWGNYDDLLAMLTEMRDAVPEWPTTWKANG